MTYVPIECACHLTGTFPGETFPEFPKRSKRWVLPSSYKSNYLIMYTKIHISTPPLGLGLKEMVLYQRNNMSGNRQLSLINDTETLS